MANRRVTAEYKREVGVRMRHTRVALGLTTAALGRMLGERANTLTQYEQGARLPDPVVLAVWANLSGITMDWIYRGSMAGLPHDLVVKLQATKFRQ